MYVYKEVISKVVYSTKKVKEISENHATLEHQSKQLFKFYIFV